MTVNELLNNISSYELTEWSAYFEVKEKLQEEEREKRRRERKNKTGRL